MPAILAIDTATTCCSAALTHDGAVYQQLSDEPRSHTRLLLPMVDALLAKANCELSDLDAIAFTAGPGSFTGLRIGLGVVQGLAFGAQVPVIPVSTLEVMALGALRQLLLADDEVVVPALDARMGEIYWGAYSVQANGDVNAVHADMLTSPELVANIVSSPVVGVGDGWQFAEQIPASTSGLYCHIAPQAEDILTIARRRFEKGSVVPVEEVQLTYLRDEVSWKKRVRLRT